MIQWGYDPYTWIKKSREDAIDMTEKKWIACGDCNRGGNGNDKDKCSCGWQTTERNHLGRYSGSEIVGEIQPKPKLTRSQKRYKRYLQVADCFKSFIDFCKWEGVEGVR